MSTNATEQFRFSHINLQELETVIKSQKNSSPGHDEIPITILKEFFDILGPVMLKICNLSLEQGVFPQSLKKARITPFFQIWWEEATQ